MTANQHLIDLEACAREQVQFIGSIQPHGLLFALSQPDNIVRQVSVNVGALLGIPADAVLGKSFGTLLGADQFDLFRVRLRSDELSATTPLRVAIGNPAAEMDCVAYRQADVLIVEFEQVCRPRSGELYDVAANLQTMFLRMDRATNILDYCDVAATEMQRVTGFDRIMVYRFDADWAGEIVAESIGAPITEPLASAPVRYLGLHFPATDIPVQARQLFRSNAVRSIADLAAPQAVIVPEIQPLTGRPLDLTHAFLRSPSLIHVEYLGNMGVRSSLAVSIVVDERLWGMLVGHHHAPRPIDCLTRSGCELIARNLSLQISLRNSNYMWQARNTAQRLLEGYIERLAVTDARVDGASFEDALFRDLMDANGLVSLIDGVVSSYGVTVPHELLLPVIEKLQLLATRGMASSEKLSEVDPSAAAYAHDVSGAVYIDVGRRGSDYLLFLRSEYITTVDWAGNPDKTLSADAEGKLHPRRSFQAWQETVRGRARPWTPLELETARFIREQITHVRDLQRLKELEALLDERKA